jgi:serine/threonine-protein kinase
VAAVDCAQSSAAPGSLQEISARPRKSHGLAGSLSPRAAGRSSVSSGRVRTVHKPDPSSDEQATQVAAPTRRGGPPRSEVGASSPSPRPAPSSAPKGEPSIGSWSGARAHRDQFDSKTEARSDSLGSADEARRQSSVKSLRTLAGGMLAWCSSGVPILVFVPGAASDKWIYGGGLALVTIAYAVLFYRAKSVASLSRGVLLPLAWAVALGASAITFGAGMCSPFTNLMSLSMVLFALSAPLRDALSVYVILALGHAAMGGLAMAGVVTSSGLLDPMGQPELRVLALSVGWVEIVYATALVLGQVVNRKYTDLLTELESAVRAAAVRDALLHEARAELDRAVMLGGPGLFTGQVLGGFVLAEVIGRGGMGEVYAAEHGDDHRLAAVKLLRRDVLSNPDIVHRFEREARIVRELRSPHVVEVYEVGGPEAPLPFIAMERLRGTDLAMKLRSVGVLPTSDAVLLAREVAAGLEVAHAAGIVHRDLKPSNLFHAEDERGASRWKILDFGVSKLLGGEDTITVDQVIGTPQYMAPEQAMGKSGHDHRADVYAFTAILYRALTGRPLFTKSNVAQLLVAVATEIPEDPRVVADVSEDVSLVLRVGLAKRADDRFASAPALATAFAEAARGELSETTRAHARRLLEREPWGAKARDSA